MLERADSHRFEVFGLVKDSENKSEMDEYLRSVGCDTGPNTTLRVALVPDSVLRSYKLTMTPMTLIVGNAGKVEKVWPGEWNPETVAAASLTLGIGFSHPDRK